MRAITGCPSAGALSGTGKGVKIPEADILAGCLICDLPNVYVRVKDGDGPLGDGGEVIIKELACHINHGVGELIELEILFYLIAIEVIPVLANFLCVIAIIPRRDGDASAFCVGDGLHVRDFLRDSSDGGWPDSFHKLKGAFWGACHAVRETPLGIIIIT